MITKEQWRELQKEWFQDKYESMEPVDAIRARLEDESFEFENLRDQVALLLRQAKRMEILVPDWEARLFYLIQSNHKYFPHVDVTGNEYRRGECQRSAPDKKAGDAGSNPARADQNATCQGRRNDVPCA